MPLIATPTAACGIASYFLSTRLTAVRTITDAMTGGIHEFAAPQGALPPYLVFAWLGGADNNQLGPYRMSSRQRYIVKAIGSGRSIVTLSAVQHAVDLALQGQGVTLSAIGADFSGVFQCVRLSAGSIGDPDLGVDYRQLYAIWQIDLLEPIT